MIDPGGVVMQQLAELESANGNAAGRRHWLGRIVKLDRRAGDARTQILAAQATLELAEDRLLAFRRIRLVKPLQKSLAGKLREMKQALKAYEAAIDYGVAPVTSAARYNIASMYDELSQELRASERPANLGGGSYLRRGRRQPVDPSSGVTDVDDAGDHDRRRVEPARELRLPDDLAYRQERHL